MEHLLAVLKQYVGLMEERKGGVRTRGAAQLRKCPPATDCGVCGHFLRDSFYMSANPLPQKRTFYFIKGPETLWGEAYPTQ
jgi:hypothetical protein